MLIHHVKGYPDPFMYSKNKGRITCDTNRVSPCTIPRLHYQKTSAWELCKAPILSTMGTSPCIPKRMSSLALANKSSTS